MKWEQVSLFDETKQNEAKRSKSKVIEHNLIESNLTESKIRRYFCEDNWWASECQGCPNYKEDLRNEHLIPRDNESVKHTTYLEFKNWLYGNFHQFIDKEIENDVWEYSPVKKYSITVSIRWRDDISFGQYVSVGWEDRRNEICGGSCPCYTFQEVRENIERCIERCRKISK